VSLTCRGRCSTRGIRRAKTGLSTDVDVLTRLAREHPLPAKILEFRGLSKLVSTYVDTLPILVDPRTGRLHTSFNQTVAATGRLSSSDPNLQNIPVRSEEGRRIRAAFVAAPGHRLIPPTTPRSSCDCWRISPRIRRSSRRSRMTRTSTRAPPPRSSAISRPGTDGAWQR
jgi:hypothetical protein